LCIMHHCLLMQPAAQGLSYQASFNDLLEVKERKQ
jgi:hypothetical protein